MGSAHRLTELNILPKFNENLEGFRIYGADTKVFRTDRRADRRMDGHKDGHTKGIPIITYPLPGGGLITDKKAKEIMIKVIIE